MITTNNIGFSVKGKNLLTDISLSFHPNEISMIVGPNGAGKSTLIHLLSQEYMCTSGNIIFDGIDMYQMSFNEIAKIRAVLSQSIQLAFPLTVEEVVKMGRYPHYKEKPNKIDNDICKQTMAFFNITELAKRNYLTLSGGEKQRVHFARVTAQIWPDNSKKTKILLLDEPLTHLDIYYQYEFLNLLQQLIQMQSMIIIGVVHDLNLAYKYANKVSLLSNGSLLASGIPDDVFTRENIQQAFKISSSILTTPTGEKLLYF